MSRILAARGRDSECELLLRQVLEKSPDLLPAYCDLAALYLRHGRIDEAIETLTRGLRVAPEDPILQNNQGMCWMLRGENEDALRCFTGAATFAPQDARYRTNMAVILSMMGRYAEAQSLFEQVLPEKEARHNLDVIAGARHDSEHAIEEDRATRALDPATRSDAPVRPPDLPENLSHARSSRLEAILAKAGVAMSGPRPEAEVGLDILPNADSVRKEH
jgi:tetratricopeptide (TPR) repeat protein